MNLKKLAKEALNKLLYEELPLSMAKEIMKLKRSPEAEELLNVIFTKLATLPNAKTSKRGDRVYIPFKGSASTINKFNSHEDEISKFLKDNDYELLDYKAGLAKDPYGRQIKLGKALTKLKNKELLNKFNNDKSRESTKNENSSYLVFSRHKYDIAGMSTNRGWDSCMNLINTRSAKIYLPSDIKRGTFIVYLVKSDDLNINKPIARVLIKCFFNIDDKAKVVYFPEEKVHGTPPSDFQRKVREIILSVQTIPFGKYKLKPGLYCDSYPRRVVQSPRIMDILHGEKYPETEDDVRTVLYMLGLSAKLATIHDDLTVSYLGDVVLNSDSIPLIPRLPVHFREIHGTFTVDLKTLETCEGFPKIVHNTFKFMGCPNITSLKGFPETLKSYCYISSLENLSSLRYISSEIGRSFSILRCKKLNTLEHGPRNVGLIYKCVSNNLKSLKGAPKVIEEDFICRDNKLKDLVGSPKTVYGTFDCSENELITLNGIPKLVRGDFICNDNAIRFTEKDVRSKCKVYGNVIV